MENGEEDDPNGASMSNTKRHLSSEGQLVMLSDVGTGNLPPGGIAGEFDVPLDRPTGLTTGNSEGMKTPVEFGNTTRPRSSEDGWMDKNPHQNDLLPLQMGDPSSNDPTFPSGRNTLPWMEDQSAEQETPHESIDVSAEWAGRQIELTPQLEGLIDESLCSGIIDGKVNPTDGGGRPPPTIDRRGAL